VRLIDFLKGRQITALLTSLSHTGDLQEQSQASISSMIDTWLLLRAIELGGERTRGMYILKSRGMAHSSRVREYALTDHGVVLLPFAASSKRKRKGPGARSRRMAPEGTK
jgi:circadian clock protein KaiC